MMLDNKTEDVILPESQMTEVTDIPLSAPNALVTVEHLLYALCLLIAMGIRFAGLGSLQPLSPLEASQSWPAWLDAMAQSSTVETVAYSPLLYAVQRFFFWLTDGGNDAWARAFPAVLGSLLVLVPWGLRLWVGRGTALILAVLLALDPWLVNASRSADSAILSITLGALLAVGLLQWPRLSVSGRRGLAVVAALFLLSGPLAWLFLPVLGLIAWSFPPAATDISQTERRTLLLITGGTLLLVGTSFFNAWEGLALISSSLSTALAYFSESSSYPISWPWLRLVVDQPLLVVGSLTGIIWGVYAWSNGHLNQRWGRLLAAWIAYTVIVLLLARTPSTLLLLGLPLLVITACAASAVIQFATHRLHRQDAMLIAVALTVLLITAGFLSAFLLRQAGEGRTDQRIFIFYLVIPILVAFFAWWANGRTAAQVTAGVVLVTFLAANLSSSWMMNLRTEMVRGNALAAITSDVGVRLLAEDVAKISAIRSGDPGALAVGVDVDPELRPLVGWYLRFVRDLRFEGNLNGDSAAPAGLLITRQIPTVLPEGLVGSDYTVVTEWLPFQLTDRITQLRWLLYRNIREPLPARTLILWGPVTQ